MSTNPRRTAFRGAPHPFRLEDAAEGCRNRRFRSPARQGHGTPKRGYSPRNRVRQLPPWGHRGRAASRSAASSTARWAGSVSSLNASERLDILSGCGGVGRHRRGAQARPGTIGLVSLRGVPEPVVSDLVKAARQDVLEEERGGTRRPAAARCAARPAPRSFQRKVTWVWSMPRIRALLMAVRKTYRDR